MNFPWPTLELLPGPAVPWLWRRQLGEHFDSFAAAFLQRSATAVRFYPCPRDCGCAHEIVAFGPNEFVGVCRCESWSCDDLQLSADDFRPLELNWAKLGRALATVFGLESKPGELNIPWTRQIGSWSADAVPVMLTIPNSPAALRRTLLELAGRLRRSFILLAPTAAPLEVANQELLAQLNAGFFSLEACVSFAAGRLNPAKMPGELFTRFTPQPKEPLDEDVARQAFALVQQFDSHQPMKPPGVLSVFRLYCLEELSIAQVARKLHCSKPTVLRRLTLLRQQTGVDPKALRRFSPHFSKIEQDLTDDRAARIHRRAAMDDDVQEDG